MIRSLGNTAALLLLAACTSSNPTPKPTPTGSTATTDSGTTYPRTTDSGTTAPDTVPPGVTCPNFPAGELEMSGEPSVTLRVTDPDPAALSAETSLDGQGAITTSPSADGTLSYVIPDTQRGIDPTHTFELTAEVTDAAGNTGTVTCTFIGVEHVIPTLEILSPIRGGVYSGEVVFEAQVGDTWSAASALRVELSVDGFWFATAAVGDDGLAVVMIPSLGETEHTVVVTVTDEAGNVATRTTTWTEEDAR